MKLTSILKDTINDKLDLLEAVAKSIGKEAANLDRLIQNIPSLYVSENWGKLDTDERIEFENYVKAFTKGAATPEDKLATFIKNVNLAVERTPTNATFSKLFSRLALLKTVNNIVDGFSPSGAGFIFEALTAAIMGGTQVTEKNEEGTLANADVMVDTKSYSMKLLAGETDLKGSKEGLAKGIKDTGPVTYIIMRRSAENRIDFYSAVVDETCLFAKDAKKNYGNQMWGFIQNGDWKSYSSGRWSLSEKPQFKFAPSKANLSKYFIPDSVVYLGTLKVSKGDVRTAVQASLAEIQETISPIYDNLKQFTTDLHKYFSAERTKEKQKAAANAKQSSKNLDSATQQTVK